MLPLKNYMANGDVLKTIKRILESSETTIPANITAQLLFAAMIELMRRFDNHLADHQADAKDTSTWRDMVEGQLSEIKAVAKSSDLLEAEKDKVRVTIPALFERLIQPVIVALVTAVVVGAILLYLRGAP